MTAHRAQITEAAAALTYLTAGKATITAVSKATGARYTYRVTRAPVSRADSEPPYFVSVLVGSDEDYVYVGTIFDGERFTATRKSVHREGSKPWEAFRFVWEAIRHRHRVPASLELWHEGRCGRCGRPLTVPESITTGLGPICAGKALSF